MMYKNNWEKAVYKFILKTRKKVKRLGKFKISKDSQKVKIVATLLGILRILLIKKVWSKCQMKFYLMKVRQKSMIDPEGLLSMLWLVVLVFLKKKWVKWHLLLKNEVVTCHLKLIAEDISEWGLILTKLSKDNVVLSTKDRMMMIVIKFVMNEHQIGIKVN